MPNILIVGFGKDSHAVEHQVVLQIRALLGKDIAQKSVTTLLESAVRTCGDGSPAPYLIVRDNKRSRAGQVAKHLREKLRLDVETELIGFIPGDADDLQKRLSAWRHDYQFSVVGPR